MADMSLQTELRRIQQKHGYKSDLSATSRTRSNVGREEHDDESSSTADVMTSRGLRDSN